MIHLIYGENIFLQEQSLHKLVKECNAQPEYIDVSLLTLPQLADIVRGGTLFSTKRCVVLRQLSANSELFAKLAEWAGEVPADTTIILIETKLDKRTKATKAMIKVAKIIAVDPLTERDARTAGEWLQTLAKVYKLSLNPTQCQQMIARALIEGDKPNNRTIDQMQLYRALQAMQGKGTVTDDEIATVLPPAITDSVFDLLETAVQGDASAVTRAIQALQPTDDGYRVVGLVFGQWAQLAALAAIGNSSPQTATDLNIHPFVAKRLFAASATLTRAEIRSFTQLAADLDTGVKISRLTPWDAVHQLLYTIAMR